MPSIIKVYGFFRSIFINPALYILAMALSGAFLISHGIGQYLGNGAFNISLGIFLIIYMIALARGAARG